MTTEHAVIRPTVAKRGASDSVCVGSEEDGASLQDLLEGLVEDGSSPVGVVIQGVIQGILQDVIQDAIGDQDAEYRKLGNRFRTYI